MKPAFWLRIVAAATSFIILSPDLQAQSNCDLFDDFSSPAGWTQVGDLVSIQSGVADYQNGAPDAEQRRVYKNLGVFLAADDTWAAEIDFKPVSVGNYNGPHAGHAILSLTAGSQEPFSNCPDVPCTGYPPAQQDGVICMFGSATNPSDGNSYFILKAIEGSSAAEYTSPLITANALGVPYFVRLERISPTLARLSVFSDAARTIHLPGSPVELSIPASIEGLNTVQHGNIARGGPYRELTGEVDNLCINWNGSGGNCPPDRTLAGVTGSTININTGVDENLNVLPFGMIDPRWTIVSNTLPPMSTLDRWNFSPVTSQWIGFDNNQGSNETNYKVRFSFCTEKCGDYRLNFRMLADNGACVYLDGALVPSSWWASSTPIQDCTDNPGDQSPFIPTAGYQIDHTLGLLSGVHTLEIDVMNFSGSLTSINIQGGIETVELHDCVCPPDRTMGSFVGSEININTGVDENLNMLPFGTIDPRWTIVSNTLPPMSTLDRWNFSPVTSQWIGFDNNEGSNETNYKVRFTFCTQQCGDYRLNFRMLADNGACVYIDDALVPSSWWASGTPIQDCNDNPGDQSPFIPTAGYLIDHTLPLSGGAHTIEIDVMNFSGSLTSINIQGSIKLAGVHDCPCPTDRTLNSVAGSRININTGVDENLNVLPFGTLDPRWSIVSSTLPPMSTLDRWNFSPVTSQWIGFDNNQGSNETNYKVRFSFCTEHHCDYRLNFRMLADNGACVYLDGILVPSFWYSGHTLIPDCTYNPGDQSPFIPTAGYLIDHTVNLLNGTHTLEIDVMNFSGSLTSINIQGGIEVEGSCLVLVDDASAHSTDLRVFPNPAQDHISVTWENDVPENLHLTDVLGRTFRGIDVPKNTNQLQIPLDGLQPGTYFLVWQDNTGRVFSRRFVKI